MRRKRTNNELKAARPTLEELAHIPRLPIAVLAENIRSVHNVGSIFRSADGFGAQMVYLTGYTAYPPREDLHKVALGAEEAVPWEHHADPLALADSLRDAGWQLLAVEQTIDSVSLYETTISYPVCFMVGNEVTGLSEELLARAHHCVELPMRGIKQSLNVSVATGVVGYELARVYQAGNEQLKMKSEK